MVDAYFYSLMKSRYCMYGKNYELVCVGFQLYYALGPPIHIGKVGRHLISHLPQDADFSLRVQRSKVSNSFSDSRLSTQVML